MAIPYRAAAMLDHVEAAFHRASQDPGVFVLDGRLLGRELPQRRVSLSELRPHLLHPATSFETRDRVLGHAVVAARAHPDPWALGLTWLLLPGLRYMATRLIHAGADPEEADAEMVAGVLDALDHRALGAERIASSICWHAYRRARLHLGLNAPPVLSLEGLPAPLEAPSPSLSANPEEVLVVAVRAGVITGADAELLASNRLESRSLAELAPAFGAKPDALKKRRVRAEKRIVALLDDSHWGVVPLRGRLGAQWNRALSRRGSGGKAAGRYRARPSVRIGEGRSPDPWAGLWTAPGVARCLAGAAA